MNGSHEELVSALQTYFGFDTFKGNQEAIIRNVMEGKDTFVLMPTGGGKSLCFQLPSLIMDGVAIVISPLIALMKNQVDAMSNYSEEEGVAHFINSSLSRGEINAVKDDVLAGKTKLLYLAPESLQKAENVDFLRGVKISFYAVDEAHCISEWGHDFRPEYSQIKSMVQRIGKAPIIALTATATPKVQKDIQKNLGMLDATVFKSSFNRPNLYYEVRPKTAEVDKDLVRFIRGMEGKSGIVYCLARKEVEDLAQVLQVNGISARPYHAGMDAATRSANQDAFLMEECQVIVATIAFGMGIDKPDVRFVVHYDIPKSLEGYYQETGRAGRDGGEGICLCFYSPDDIERLRRFQKDKTPKEIGIGNQLLFETQSYAESTICRRKLLLHYFGEEYTEDKCGNCDNCRKTYKQVDASELLQIALETIQQVNEKHRAEHIAHKTRLLMRIHINNRTPIRRRFHESLLLAEINQIQNVFLETGTAKANARLQKLRPDARVRANRTCHFRDVRTRLLAKLGKRIHTGNALREKRVGRQFRQLRRPNIRRQNALPRNPIRIDVDNRIARFQPGWRLLRTDQNAIRFLQIRNRRTFRKKLGIR